MQDKVVIITGGSSGIGKALARSFGQRGAKVIITGRRPDALEETVQALAQEGIKVESITSDVSKEEDNQRMADEVLTKYGRIDILINNAGISMRALFEEVDLNVVKKVMDINFYGCFTPPNIACLLSLKIKAR